MKHLLDFHLTFMECWSGLKDCYWLWVDGHTIVMDNWWVYELSVFILNMITWRGNDCVLIKLAENISQVIRLLLILWIFHAKDPCKYLSCDDGKYWYIIIMNNEKIMSKILFFNSTTYKLKRTSYIMLICPRITAFSSNLLNN